MSQRACYGGVLASGSGGGSGYRAPPAHITGPSLVQCLELMVVVDEATNGEAIQWEGGNWRPLPKFRGDGEAAPVGCVLQCYWRGVVYNPTTGILLQELGEERRLRPLPLILFRRMGHFFKWGAREGNVMITPPFIDALVHAAEIFCFKKVSSLLFPGLAHHAPDQANEMAAYLQMIRGSARPASEILPFLRPQAAYDLVASLPRREQEVVIRMMTAFPPPPTPPAPLPVPANPAPILNSMPLIRGDVARIQRLREGMTESERRACEYLARRLLGDQNIVALPITPDRSTNVPTPSPVLAASASTTNSGLKPDAASLSHTKACTVTPLLPSAPTHSGPEMGTSSTIPSRTASSGRGGTHHFSISNLLERSHEAKEEEEGYEDKKLQGGEAGNGSASLGGEESLNCISSVSPESSAKQASKTPTAKKARMGALTLPDSSKVLIAAAVKISTPMDDSEDEPAPSPEINDFAHVN